MEISKETLKNADFNNEIGEEAVKISITLKLIKKTMPKLKCLMMRLIERK